MQLASLLSVVRFTDCYTHCTVIYTHTVRDTSLCQAASEGETADITAAAVSRQAGPRPLYMAYNFTHNLHASLGAEITFAKCYTHTMNNNNNNNKQINYTTQLRDSLSIHRGDFPPQHVYT